MSRIGKMPISVPIGVSIHVGIDKVTVKGKKGELHQSYLPQVKIEVKNGLCTVTRTEDSKSAHALHGLYRSLVYNMVVGVSEGFTKTLDIIGVGYRAELKSGSIMLNLGYSMPIEYVLPEGIAARLDTQNRIVISGISKEQVGKVASEIRGLRPPEPYKGKGIKYADERIVRKAGKSGVK